MWLTIVRIIHLILSIILVAIVVVSCFSISASAQTGFWLGGTNFSYNGNTYATCKLTNTKKAAKVKVTLTADGPLTIKMTDTRGRYIWGEDNTIKPNWMGAGSRTYKLGKDHSVYRLYFRTTYKRTTGFCSVKAVSNCSVY